MTRSSMIVVGAGCLMVVAIVVMALSNQRSDRGFPASGEQVQERSQPTAPADRPADSAEGAALPISTTPFEKGPAAPDTTLAARRPRTIYSTAQMNPADRDFYHKIMYILDRPWWEIYDLAEGNSLKEKLIAAWKRVEPSFMAADFALLRTRSEVQAARIEAGQYETYLPTQITDASGRVGYQGVREMEQPRTPDEDVMTSTCFDPNLRRDIKRVVRVGLGESLALDRAREALAMVKSSASAEFRLILTEHNKQ